MPRSWDHDVLRAAWHAEETRAFTGWDFSYLEGRVDTDPLPWDYRAIAVEHLKPSDRLLDMGTGGGEFLLALGHRRELTTVTEAWPPNVDLCRQRLAPLGITVAQTFDDDRLPFPDASFDVVLNRHASFDAAEVFRVLAPGGVFVTQQVGGRNNADLAGRLIDNRMLSPQSRDLAGSHRVLLDAGFAIRVEGEAFPVSRYMDVGAVVYQTRVIKWEFPGFSVDACFDKLLDLHDQLATGQPITATEHRFMLVAAKPAPQGSSAFVAGSVGTRSSGVASASDQSV